MSIRCFARAALAATALLAAGAALAAPKVVAGPGADPQCFKPWEASTTHLQWPAKTGPYRVALVNGFVGNTWRIQMIQTAKAYVEKPDIKPLIKDFKVVSTGTDAAAQLGAIEDFINQGFDAIVTIAVSPTGFDRVIRAANRANVVLVPFDNVLDTKEVMQVNEDQLEMGRMHGRWLVENVGKSGALLEVRGIAGNSVDRDRHIGFREVVEAPGTSFKIVEVVGNWDDGAAQKAVADALAVHGKFDGLYVQGGTTGAVRALMDAGHPLVPVSGEAENGFRKLIAEHKDKGLKGLSVGQSPGMVAVAIKAALSALQGHPMPQLISMPIPSESYKTLEAGKNFWPELTDNFFTANAFPACGVDISGIEIMAQTKEDRK
ncbi:ABC transporter substrate-binding protein [Azospirillum sp. RWY-5-1]|uniref:ABC transporter substrate-binding protein n=1 Tax=Azospirillum oleiclasticum TaxID=2735135 RepID=A0ABX2TJ83_9PROT|nr:sugar ABC transporter substrate-binding protein [Azospirillum oleiclasticum]NYZ14421.1 ABC transporter substrate-binding protein [Azospirillum oleiclasticum]NYZ23227.1 ABC transporter substrate-binding protein [Azospirillum oleiclasticum]